MNSDGNEKLDQLRAEARIEQLLRCGNQNLQTIPELEHITKRIFKLKFWGVQLEVRRWMTP